MQDKHSYLWVKQVNAIRFGPLYFASEPGTKQNLPPLLYGSVDKYK